jgi:hypothetical protein
LEGIVAGGLGEEREGFEGGTTAEGEVAGVGSENENGEAEEREDAEREARLQHPAALAAAALWYASHGIAVFPLQPGGKVPITRNGFKDATTDEAAVRAWWARTPQANIGSPTGIRSDVIDVDGPKGYASLAGLEAAGFAPNVLAFARTPRGLHLHVAVSGGGNTTGWYPGIDLRGRGGYVVMPPSRADDGRAWRWAAPPVLLAQAVDA